MEIIASQEAYHILNSFRADYRRAVKSAAWQLCSRLDRSAYSYDFATRAHQQAD